LILAIPHDRPYSGGNLAVSGDEDDAIVYTVVINDEEQYSIWPSQKALRGG
jgi:hypothetical protein